MGTEFLRFFARGAVGDLFSLAPRTITVRRPAAGLMGGITIRVIDGADRGRSYHHLAAPITIGREEGNSIQLNDERVSRFHLKIQEDHDRLVLTDLASTNGTKVNGEEVQLRILRFGDVIALGRSVLLFGTREEIADRLQKLRSKDVDNSSGTGLGEMEQLASVDCEVSYNEEPELQAALHALEPPEMPERLTPGQAAQLAELLEYLHIRVRGLIASCKVDERSESAQIDGRQWQSLIDLQAKLAEYLRAIGNPG